MNSRSHILRSGLALALAPFAAAAPVTPGNLVVLRAGDGSAAITNAATAVFLDEFTPAGVPVQTIPVPAAGAAGLTISGSATSEGIMSRAQNGAILLFAGYRKDAGGTNPVTDAPAVTNRVIGTLLADGTVSTAVTLTDPTGNMRSATTVSGSSYYFATSTSVRYLPDPSQSTSVQIDGRNSRQVVLSGNTLFAANGSTAVTAKVQSYGTLPTGAATPVPVVTLATGDAVNSFCLFDVDPGVAGDDTIFAASVVENRLRKYTFDGAAWTDRGFLSASGSFHLTGSVSGTAVTLFATSATTLFSLTDASGPGGTLGGTLTTLTTAGTNTVFRGIGMFAPAVQTAALTLLSWSLTPLGGGGQQAALTVLGSPNAGARLEASENLTAWTTLQTITLDDGGNGSFSAADPAAGSRRFYRASSP